MADWMMLKRGGDRQVPLVVLPGWGFTGEVLRDQPVFAGETLIVPEGFISPDLIESLVVFLADQQIDVVRILGWSMGGNLGVDFLGQYPERVRSLTLVAVRRSWPVAEIGLTRQGLVDPTGTGMDTFYRKCFLGARVEYQEFIGHHIVSCVDHYDFELLDAGLDYLAGYRMPEALSLPVHIIQGEKDIVCLASEMVHFSSDTRLTMLAGAGHFPFSHADFKI